MVTDDPECAPDLYRGVAQLYDEFRLPYAPQLITQLLDDTRPTGHGRALDLGCGPGLLAFALADSFAEVWAVDPEPDMIDVVRSKITSSGARTVHPVVASAEDWLAPGGHLALCWSSSPWSGPGEWKPVATSFLPITVFGDRTAEFEAELAERLRPYLQDGVVTDQVSYAYDLFSRQILSCI